MVLEAEIAKSSTENGVAILAFADDANAPSQYILLQKTLTPSEQDTALGHDKVHIEINEEPNSVYGEILEACLHSDGLTLHLSHDTASRLQSSQRVDIRIKLSEQKMQDIQAKLRLLVEPGRINVRS